MIRVYKISKKGFRRHQSKKLDDRGRRQFIQVYTDLNSNLKINAMAKRKDPTLLHLLLEIWFRLAIDTETIVIEAELLDDWLRRMFGFNKRTSAKSKLVILKEIGLIEFEELYQEELVTAKENNPEPSENLQSKRKDKESTKTAELEKTPALQPARDEAAAPKVSDANNKMAEEGMRYLASLNSPNHMNIGWVKGYLSIQFQELEQSKTKVPQAEIIRIWRDVCDAAVAKNASAPQWFKTAFSKKVSEWKPGQPSASSRNTQAGPDYPKDAAGRYTNHIGHNIYPGKDLSLPYDSLDLNCKADRMVARGFRFSTPEEALRQVEADEEARKFLIEYCKQFPNQVKKNDWTAALEKAKELCQK